MRQPTALYTELMQLSSCEDVPMVKTCIPSVAAPIENSSAPKSSRTLQAGTSVVCAHVVIAADRRSRGTAVFGLRMLIHHSARSEQKISKE